MHPYTIKCINGRWAICKLLSSESESFEIVMFCASKLEAENQIKLITGEIKELPVTKEYLLENWAEAQAGTLVTSRASGVPVRVYEVENTSGGRVHGSALDKYHRTWMSAAFLYSDLVRTPRVRRALCVHFE